MGYDIWYESLVDDHVDVEAHYSDGELDGSEDKITWDLLFVEIKTFYLFLFQFQYLCL